MEADDHNGVEVPVVGSPPDAPAVPGPEPSGERVVSPPGAEELARRADAVPAPPEHPHPSRKHHVAPALIPLLRVDDDVTFRLRPEGDLSALATDLARLGQLFPVDLRLKPPDRFQVICGFRRVAALRFLQRDKVMARLHTDLSDEDALLLALAGVLHGTTATRDDLKFARERLAAEGRLTPVARDMLERALATESALAPENAEEEVDADELAVQVTARLAEINQDLSLLADVFLSLDRSRQEDLLRQLAYSVELVAYLEGR